MLCLTPLAESYGRLVTVEVEGTGKLEVRTNTRLSDQQDWPPH